jgi:hypothetical protein
LTRFATRFHLDDRILRILTPVIGREHVEGIALIRIRQMTLIVRPAISGRGNEFHAIESPGGFAPGIDFGPFFALSAPLVELIPYPAKQALAQLGGVGLTFHEALHFFESLAQMNPLRAAIARNPEWILGRDHELKVSIGKQAQQIVFQNAIKRRL